MWKGCGKVSAEIIDINERARDLWDAYLAAKARAEATGEYRDARTAGRLWGQFLDHFTRDPGERGTVLQYRQRNAR
jgi:hypothetical protein